jgi:hypothetical protein
MATSKKTSTSKQLVVNKDGSVSQGTVSFNSKGQVTSTSGGGSSNTQITQNSGSADQIAQRAVETTNSLYGGDPNITAYKGTFLPGSGGNTAPATNDNYASVYKPTGPVTTSDPATNAVDNLNNQINTGLNNPPVSPMPGNPMGQYNPAFDPSKDLAVAKEIQEGNKIYADRQKELKAERDAAIADLKVSAAEDKRLLAENQRKETGVTNRNLAYLQQGGQSASAQAYMNDLEIGHSREQANLTAKYNSAILAARTAYSEKDFQLADAMVKNAQTIKKDAYQRNQDFLDNAIKINTFIMTQKKFEFDMQQAEYDKQTQAKQFAIDNGIEQQFYDVGGIVYRTSDGQAFSTAQDFVAAGGDPNFKNVYVVKPGSKEAKAYVYDLAMKYPDSGINPSDDDPATAMAKVKNSAIYREQVRPPSSGGGGGSGDALNADLRSDISAITSKWQNNGWLNSGYIGSKEYKAEKSQFVSNYAVDITDPGKTFDSFFMQYVNSNNKDSYASDYGLN